MGSRIVPAVANAPIVITNTGTQMTFVFDGRNLVSGTSDPKNDFEWQSVLDVSRDQSRIQSIERTALTSPALPNLRNIRLQLSYNITGSDVAGITYNSDLNRPECGAHAYLEGHTTLNLEESLFSAVGSAASFTYPAFASGAVPLSSQISVKRVRAGVTSWLINAEDGSGRAADFSVNTTTRVVSLSGAGNTAAGDSYTVVYNRSAAQFQIQFRGFNATQGAMYANFEKTRLNTQGKAGTLEQLRFYGGLNGAVNFGEADGSGYPGATIGSVTTSVAWFNGVAWPIYDTLQVSRDGMRHSAANPIGYCTTPGGVTQFAIGFPVAGGPSSTDVNDLSVYVGGSLVNGIPTGGTKQNPNGITYTIAASGTAPSYGVINFGVAPAAGLVYWRARNNNNLQILAPEDGVSTLLLGASGGVQSLKLQAIGQWDQRTVTPTEFTIAAYLSVGQNNDPGLSGDNNPTPICFRRTIGTGSPRGTATAMNLGGTGLGAGILAIDGTSLGTKIPAAQPLVAMSVNGSSTSPTVLIYHTDYSTRRIILDGNPPSTASGYYIEFKDGSNNPVFSVNYRGELSIMGSTPQVASQTATFAAVANKPGVTSGANPVVWLPFRNGANLVWVPAWAN